MACAAKEVINGKVKHERRRKSAALEAGELQPEPQLEVARMIRACYTKRENRSSFL